MDHRFRRLRTRYRGSQIVTYWQDRLTGNVFATSRHVEHTHK